MALVNLQEILKDAREKKYAVGAFDVSNYEMIRAVIEVAEEEKSPVILMGLKLDLEGIGIEYLMSMMKLAAEGASVPVCIHLDHATEYDLIKRAIDHGFTSVMYDGSILSLEENIINTKRVCELAHKYGVNVEAELGHVGDGITGNSETASDEIVKEKLTLPEEMARFINETEVDALAVSIGTAHGVYVSEPKLDFKRLEILNKISTVPLVLHGGSGTPDNDIRKSIELGISKINIYSEVLNAYYSELKRALNASTNMSLWPSVVNKEPVENMKKVIRSKIRLFGSNNRAMNKDLKDSHQKDIKKGDF
ncbi:MAG: ketose-bisphosphate aldolase [Firmicutes bacterium HGW-Firmicutes-7]|nr:MAG: ketose-bisphosphate aldolase [Firmicutes bacterium HGW-Firmicutes-7]